MAATNGSKSYPLSEGGKVRSHALFPLTTLLFLPFLQKKSGAFKDRYSLFWSKLGEKLRSTKSVKKSSSGPEILRVIVDLLISFSILALVNIRNAATVASLSLGKSLLDECVELNEQISVVDRQLVATAKGQKKVYESNPKYQACLKQKNSLKEVRCQHA